MELRLAAGLASVRILAGFIFFLAAGLRLGVPGRFPVGRAIAASALAGAAGLIGPPLLPWPLYPAALLGSLLAFYRPSPGWTAGAFALGLAYEGAIRLAGSIST